MIKYTLLLLIILSLMPTDSHTSTTPSHKSRTNKKGQNSPLKTTTNPIKVIINQPKGIKTFKNSINERKKSTMSTCSPIAYNSGITLYSQLVPFS